MTRRITVKLYESMTDLPDGDNRVVRRTTDRRLRASKASGRGPLPPRFQPECQASAETDPSSVTCVKTEMSIVADSAWPSCSPLARPDCRTAGRVRKVLVACAICHRVL